MTLHADQNITCDGKGTGSGCGQIIPPDYIGIEFAPKDDGKVIHICFECFANVFLWKQPD